MYARLLANDASCNGRFFTGVLTTGIYCLPSCRARKPKSANVRFFPSVETARAAGLRPCRKCYPDDFARGADPVLEQIETLAAEVRSAPSRFAGVAAVMHRSGFGATRLFELFRQHYHSTPPIFFCAPGSPPPKRASRKRTSPSPPSPTPPASRRSRCFTRISADSTD
jgi:AraC family transcriptional regulator of adaptative response / DNA-3-methyladenine glycosylase II